MSNSDRLVYVNAAFKYAKDMKSEIENVALVIGVSEGVIAGALAEEADTVLTLSPIDKVIDSTLNSWVLDDTHEKLKSNYDEVIAEGIIDDKTGFYGKINTLFNNTMIDIGYSNIRVAIAIRDIHEYFSEYSSDPLGLGSEYLNDYSVLVQDLANPEGSLLTATISALEKAETPTQL